MRTYAFECARGEFGSCRFFETTAEKAFPRWSKCTNISARAKCYFRDSWNGARGGRLGPTVFNRVFNSRLTGKILRSIDCAHKRMKSSAHTNSPAHVGRAAHTRDLEWLSKRRVASGAEDVMPGNKDGPELRTNGTRAHFLQPYINQM